jgi:hypothetical protein
MYYDITSHASTYVNLLFMAKLLKKHNHELSLKTCMQGNFSKLCAVSQQLTHVHYIKLCPAVVEVKVIPGLN